VSIELSVDPPKEGLAPPMFPILVNFPFVLFEGESMSRPKARGYPLSLRQASRQTPNMRTPFASTRAIFVTPNQTLLIMRRHFKDFQIQLCGPKEHFPAHHQRPVAARQRPATCVLVYLRRCWI